MTSESDEAADTGTAGASARREHERRRANRQQRVREKHPRISGVLLALSDTPQHEAAWARGAEGEERVGESLTRRLHDGTVLLHDRRVPRSRTNIDHIVVAPSGIWVIDSKRYKGKVAVKKPLFGDAKLLIGGRDKSKLADGLGKQVELVRAAVHQERLELPVRGVLCFVDAELPLLGTLTFRGFPLVYPKRLAKRINQPGPLQADQIPMLATAIAGHFPCA